MSIHIIRQGDEIIASGGTFPLKDRIKALGGSFNGSSKKWHVPYSEGSWKALVALSHATGGRVLEVSSDDQGQSTSTSPQVAAASQAEASNSALGVAALMTQVASRIAGAFPRMLWIIGEIQNSRSFRGSTYFSLAEPSSSGKADYTVDAVIWQDRHRQLVERYSAKQLDELLCDGMKVKVQAMITLHAKRGKLSLNVSDVDPSFTQGEIALARQKVVSELKKQGVFYRNKQLAFPLFPRRIGLISAPGSRAYSDFIHQLQAGPWGWEVLFCPAAMQGSRSSYEVRSALRVLQGCSCDVLIITRGGGSAADLHSFNDFELARTAALLDVPLLVAIGHHEDECALQDVAHKELKTPTALADYLLYCMQDLEQRVQDLTHQLSALLERVVVDCGISLERSSRTLSDLLTSRQHEIRGRLQLQQSRLYEAAGEQMHSKAQQLTALGVKLSWELTHHQQQIHSGYHRLIHRLLFAVQQRGQEIERSGRELEKSFEVHNPLPWIEEGWSPVMRHRQRLKSIDDLKVGEKVQLALKDGGMEAQILSLRPFSASEERAP